MSDGNVPIQSKSRMAGALRIAAVVLAGTLVAALLFGWAGFLFWLVVKAVMSLVHWF